MRLITHNLLQCAVTSCNINNYPLSFSNVELERLETDFNPNFILSMLPRLEYKALLQTAFQLGISGLPEVLPEEIPMDSELLKLLHTVLMETRVKSGEMVCNNCHHVYPIKDGIANMLLAEHEL